MGLTAEVTSSRDLDSLDLVLVESKIDGGVRGGFQGLWADQVRNMPTKFVLNGGDIHFTDVEAGRVCTVVAMSHRQSIPKSAELHFRAVCREGDREWIVPVSTGDVPIIFTSSE